MTSSDPLPYVGRQLTPSPKPPSNIETQGQSPQSPPQQAQSSQPQSSLQHSTLTVRIVRSFEYKTMRTLILPSLDFSTVTLRDIFLICKYKAIGLPNSPFLRISFDHFDTFKLDAHAFGAKSNDQIINLTGDEKMTMLRNWDVPLESLGLSTFIIYLSLIIYD
jgi:hypothetical protein